MIELQWKLDTKVLNNNLDLIDIYKILHPELEYTFSYVYIERLHIVQDLGHKATSKISKNGYYIIVF